GMQLDMLSEAQRLVERSARWLVRAAGRSRLDVAALIARFEPGARLLASQLPGVLSGQDLERFVARQAELSGAGVPAPLAHRIASMQALLSVFDIVVDANATGAEEEAVAAVYFEAGARLGLDWLRDRILELPRDDRWQALSRAALRDDLYRLHRSLTREILLSAAELGDGDAPLQAWLDRNAEDVERCQSVLADVKESHEYDVTTLPVVLRELRALVADSGQLT
ncbi:MAG: NAD-glutamate dehydrogenase, partial [Solirubrobacteraceae bacterium]